MENGKWEEKDNAETQSTLRFAEKGKSVHHREHGEHRERGDGRSF
jgi:predicted transcriptional regulator